ncbi:MAG: D-alanyl-D-alanine carboxypeptidase family protein [Bauldia sp.]
MAAVLVVGGLAAAPGPASAAPDAAIVLDAKTGKTLYADHADSRRHPASLTKMMTLYLLFEAIEDGRTSLASRVKISAAAAGQAPSKLGLKAGETISVRDAILSLVTKSANDIAVAVAEHLAGSERAFAAQMNNKARALGMVATNFRNASGLPDGAQITTARDMATLGAALREHHPQYYTYFATPSFVWKGRRISNHNHLLGKLAGVDGIKTGYTRASGFNLVASVDRDGRQIVAVVIGGESSKWRDQHMTDLIKTYLPRAARGPRTAAAIPGGPSPTTAGAIALESYPAPRLRPEGAGAKVASAAGANSPTVPGSADAEGDAAVGDEAQASATPGAALDGWKIQIAAAPTRSSAEDILDRALSKASAVLAGAAPYTEPVTVGDAVLYRARFAGFRDKQAASAACSYLVERNFNCLALSN